MTKAAIIGNCQIEGIGRSLQAMYPNFEFQRIRPGDIATATIATGTEIILLQDDASVKDRIVFGDDVFSKYHVVQFPGIYFTAFHPDFSYISYGAERFLNPIGHINSAIVVIAWKEGLSIDETLRLFKRDVFHELGYFSHWDVSAEKLIEDGNKHDIDLTHELELWRKTGCFVNCPNHPKTMPLAGIAREILKKLGETPRIRHPENFLDDPLIYNLVWPQYPEVAAQFGLQGEYIFRGGAKTSDPFSKCLNLAEFVEGCFEMWADKDPSQLKGARLQDGSLEKIKKFRKSPRAHKKLRSPYSGIDDFQLWKRAVATPEVEDLDPVIDTKFKISKLDKVATAGSCFAQHISRALRQNGYNYFVTEDGEGLLPDEAISRNYGVFSARYGNVYTTRQLVQLIDRSEGMFDPAENSWVREDGRLVDPFRPQVEPTGFDNLAALEASRKEHLASVSRIWRECDVLVFTLGLTEAWISKLDGAAFPLAPGVSGGEYDENSHVFHNLSVADTVADLRMFLNKLRALNPRVRVILTVSPVPLIATAQKQHVLVSTTQSKAALCAAAHEVTKDDPLVQYFPSYEIITGAYNRGKYFESDLRTVTSEGVAHVMRVFLKHFSESDPTPARTGSPRPSNNFLRQEIEAGLGIVCDEERIEDSIDP